MVENDRKQLSILIRFDLIKNSINSHNNSHKIENWKWIHPNSKYHCKFVYNIENLLPPFHVIPSVRLQLVLQVHTFKKMTLIFFPWRAIIYLLFCLLSSILYMKFKFFIQFKTQLNSLYSMPSMENKHKNRIINPLEKVVFLFPAGKKSRKKVKIRLGKNKRTKRIMFTDKQAQLFEAKLFFIKPKVESK